MKANQLLPTSPKEGPPLPRWLEIKWPLPPTMPLDRREHKVFQDTVTDRDGVFLIEERRLRKNRDQDNETIIGQINFRFKPGHQGDPNPWVNYVAERTEPPVGTLGVPDWKDKEDWAGKKEKLIHLARTRLAIYGVRHPRIKDPFER